MKENTLIEIPIAYSVTPLHRVQKLNLFRSWFRSQVILVTPLTVRSLDTIYLQRSMLSIPVTVSKMVKLPSNFGVRTSWTLIFIPAAVSALSLWLLTTITQHTWPVMHPPPTLLRSQFLSRSPWINNRTPSKKSTTGTTTLPSFQNLNQIMAWTLVVMRSCFMVQTSTHSTTRTAHSTLTIRMIHSVILSN